MVKAGMTPMQALVSATSTAANCLKAADQFGTMEKGKWADFLVLSAQSAGRYPEYPEAGIGVDRGKWGEVVRS